MRMSFSLKVLAIAVALPTVAFGVPPAERNLAMVSQWTAAQFWTPPAEIQSARTESIDPIGTVVAPTPLPFISVSPCRLFDSRAGQGFTGDFGPPSLLASTVRTVPIPSNTTCAGLPATAAAWSLNFVVIGLGSGYSTAYLSAFPTGAAIPNSSIINFGLGVPTSGMSVVQAGTGGAIDLFVNFEADVIIDINGYYASTGIVSSLNAKTGDVTLSAGTNITLTPTGNDIKIAATGGAGPTGPTGPAGPAGSAGAQGATGPTGSGTVTAVTGTAPVVSSGGTAPAISITAATTGAAGSMSAADKTKLDLFNAASTYAPIASPTFTGTVTAPAITGTLTGNASTATLAASATAGLGLKSATTTVAVSAATAPTVGQVLTATDGSTATWAAVPAASGDNTTLTSITGLSKQNSLQVGPYGTAAGNTGELRFLELEAGGSNYVAIKAPDALTANFTLTLPVDDGTADQVLKTDGSGILSWVTATGGTVTGVTGTAPVVSSAGAAPVISITAATTSAAGSMSADDKTKLDAVATTYAPIASPTFTGTVTAPAITGTLTGNASTATLAASATAGLGLKTATTTVAVSAATAPTVGQILTATDGSTATWAAVPAASGDNTTLTSITGLSKQNSLQVGPYGTAAGNTGELRFLELLANGTNFIALKAPDIIPDGDLTLTLPGGYGSNGNVLTTNGSGVLAWLPPSAGNVTSVAGTAPISVTGTATRTVSIDAATGSAAGSMSAADKAKLDLFSAASTYAALAGATFTGTVTATAFSGPLTGDVTGTATAALGLKSATTTVAVSTAPAPTGGQVLMATDGSTATWAAVPQASGDNTLLTSLTGLAGTPAIRLKAYNTGTSEIRFFEYNTPGTGFVALRAPLSVTVPTGYTLILPLADGSLDQALVTDGSGQLSWKTFTLPARNDGSDFEAAALSANVTVPGRNGGVETISLKEMPARLMNEVQQQARTFEQQKAELKAENVSLRAELDALRAEVAEIRGLLKK